MNYRFENSYTQAESVKWRLQAADNMNANSTSLMPAFIVFIVQFCLWAPILFFLSKYEMPFLLMAILLFISFVAIEILYDSLIMPHVAAYFDKKSRPHAAEKSHVIIDINDEEIRTKEGEQEIIFKWTGIRSIEDNEKTVFLLTETGYCAIPARCFSGFLAKDAFVRTCREKIAGRTEQGAHFV